MIDKRSLKLKLDNKEKDSRNAHLNVEINRRRGLIPRESWETMKKLSWFQDAARRKKYRASQKYSVVKEVMTESQDWKCFCCECSLRKISRFMHHLDYANYYEERAEDVVIVCETCHSQNFHHILRSLYDKVKLIMNNGGNTMTKATTLEQFMATPEGQAVISEVQNELRKYSKRNSFSCLTHFHTKVLPKYPKIFTWQDHTWFNKYLNSVGVLEPRKKKKDGAVKTARKQPIATVVTANPPPSSPAKISPSVKEAIKAIQILQQHGINVDLT